MRSVESTSTRVSRALSKRKSVADSLRVYPGSPPLRSVRSDEEADTGPEAEPQTTTELGPAADTAEVTRIPSNMTLDTLHTVDTLHDSPPGSILTKTRLKARHLFPKSHGRWHEDISSPERNSASPPPEDSSHYPASVRSSATSILSKSKRVPARMKSKLKRSLTVVRTQLRRKRGIKQAVPDPML